MATRAQIEKREKRERRDRLRLALAVLQARKGRAATSFTAIAKLMGKVGGMDAPDPSNVRRWLLGSNSPRELIEWSVLAQALEVEAGWLAFGHGNPPTLTTDASKPGLLSADEVRAYSDPVEKHIPAPQSKKGGRGGRGG